MLPLALTLSLALTLPLALDGTAAIGNGIGIGIGIGGEVRRGPVARAVVLRSNGCVPAGSRRYGAAPRSASFQLAKPRHVGQPRCAHLESAGPRPVRARARTGAASARDTGRSRCPLRCRLSSDVAYPVVPLNRVRTRTREGGDRLHNVILSERHAERRGGSRRISLKLRPSFASVPIPIPIPFPIPTGPVARPRGPTGCAVAAAALSAASGTDAGTDADAGGKATTVAHGRILPLTLTLPLALDGIAAIGIGIGI